jgi:hypothetical protein
VVTDGLIGGEVNFKRIAPAPIQVVLKVISELKDN